MGIIDGRIKKYRAWKGKLGELIFDNIILSFVKLRLRFKLSYK